MRGVVKKDIAVARGGNCSRCGWKRKAKARPEDGDVSSTIVGYGMDYRYSGAKKRKERDAQYTAFTSQRHVMRIRTVRGLVDF